MKPLDWELILKVLAAVVGLLGALIQFRQFNPRERAKLKTDFEILEKISPTDPNYEIVKKHIEQSIKVIYLEKENKYKIYSYGDLIFGILWIIGFTIWSVSIYQKNNGFSFWIIVTGLFGLIGIGGVINGFDPKKGKSK